VAFAGVKSFAAPAPEDVENSDVATRDLASSILQNFENAAGCAGCEV
jgi:hypothetical protein